MSLLNKYVQKYGNYDQVKRLQKSKDWMPQTPSSAEKESNVAAAHQYMDSLTDDDKKRIADESPLGKSLGMQNTVTLPFGFGKDNAQKSKEYQTYKAAEDILKNEAYEKKREDVVRKNGSYAYKTMKDYIGLADQVRDARKGKNNVGSIGLSEIRDLSNQAADIKKTLEKMGITGKDFDVYEQYVREYKDIEDTQAMEKKIASDIGMKPVSRGIGYTAADVFVSPITGIKASMESLRRPFYADPSAPVNTYSDLYRLQNASEAVEQSVSNQIDSKLGKFAYGAGVSTLKSAEAMAIGNYLSGALGIDAASKLGQLTTLPMFGASAFASTLADAQKKGYSAELATEKALASGIAEMLFEELSLDKAWGTLKNAQAGKGGLAKRILDVFMGAGIEGSEEVFTDLANHIADNFISGDFSDYQSGIRMRVEAGQSLDQATKEAKKEFIAQLVESGLAGAASGGLMNVGAATVGSVNYHNTAKNINANSELKREVVESAKGLKDTTAAEIANKKIEEITENDMVEILHSMEEVTEKSAHDIAKESLVRMGESEEEAEKKASAIVEAVSEENPTEEQEAKNTKLVEDEKTAEAYADVLKNRVAQNALSDVYENNQKVKQRRSGGITAMSNGNQIKVYDFADVNKGIVNTSVGAMSLDNVQMGENERRLFKTAYVFDNNNASNAYVNEYKGQNIADYSTAAMRAYTVGASGASFESFLNDPRNASVVASVDNNAFLQEMYFHGQNTIKKEDVAKVSKSAKAEAKATTQNDLQNVFNEVAKVFNINISETATGEESGAFIPSSLKLTLNQNESKNLYQTLHHELMEYSKAYAPKEYNELKSAIMDFATQKLGSPKVKMHLDIYKDTYRGFGAKTGNEAEAKKTIADATDEYVNDFVAMVMSTDDGVNQFVNYLADNSDLTEQQKTGIIQSLKDFIQKLIDSIKAYIAKHKGMNLGAADAKALTEYTEELAQIRDKIQSAWDASRAEVIAQLAVDTKDDVTDTNLSYSIRTEEAPKNTLTGYKVFVAFKNKPGELYPPMVASPNGLPTPVGLWLNADTGELARDKEGNLVTTKGGQGFGKRLQVKQGGKGTKGGSGTLAWRPGWHLGEYPDAKQFAVKDPVTGELKALFPENFIFAECEIAADEDYQLEAMEYGISEKGKFNRAYAGLPYIPKDGYYKYRTNPNPETSPWYITGAMKVTKILDDEDIRKICAKFGVTPLARKGGDINLEDYGFKKGIVTPTKDTSKYAKAIDYSDEIKQLEGYQINGKLDFNDKNVINEFKINNLDASEYEKQYNKEARHSVNVDSKGKTLTEDQAEYFKDSKIVDENGNLKVMYHGTDEGGFTVFDPSKSDDDLSLFFSDNPEVSKTYTKEHPTEFNPYLKDMDIKTAEDAIKYLESRGWKIEEPTKTDDGSTKWTYHYPGMGKATCTTESLIEHAREFQKSHKAFLYPVYLNVTNPYVLDAKGNTWRTLNGTDYEDDDYQLVDLTIEEVDEDEYEVSSFEMDYDETMSFDRIVMRFGDDIAETVQKYGGLEYRNFLFNNDTKEVLPNDTRTAAMYAYYHGYDGVMINNVIDNGSQSTQGASNIAVVFKSNQIKSIYNEHPTNNEDIRYSFNVENGVNIDAVNIKADLDEMSELFRKEFNKSVLVDYYAFQADGSMVENIQNVIEERIDDKTGKENVISRIMTLANDIDRMIDDYIEKAKKVKWLHPFLAYERDLEKYEKAQKESKIKPKEIKDFRKVDTDGNKLSTDQVKFFANSKARNANGSLKVMYHGARGAGFTVFNPRYSDDRRSLFFTDSLETASSYNATKELFEPDKPMKFAELSEVVESFSRGDQYLKKDGKDVVLMKLGYIQDPEDIEVFRGTLKEVQTYFMDSVEDIVNEDNATYKVFLNLKNPMIVDADNNYWNELPLPADYDESFSNVEIYKTGDVYEADWTENGEEKHGEFADWDAVEKKFGRIWEEFEYDSIHIDDIYIGFDGSRLPNNTRSYAEYAENHGYDGVIFNDIIDNGVYTTEKFDSTTVMIAFNANQVKSVYNLHPTENDDIRYSLEVEDWNKLFSEMTEVKESNRILAEGLKSIDNVKLNKKITDKIASEIKSEYKSRIDKKVLSESLEKVFSYMLDTGSPSYGDLAEIMREVAMPVIEQATEVMAEEKRMYDTFKEKMKGYRIKLNAKQKAEVAQTFGSYYAFKNALFGNVVFSESGSELDSIWQSVVEASDGMLDIGTSDANQPMALYEFIQGLKPSYRNIYGADQEEAAYDVALSIFRKFLLEQEYENNPKLRQEALKLNEAHQKYRKTLKQNSDKRIKEAMDEIKIERQINIKRLIREINELNEEESNVIKGSIEQAFIVKQKEQYERRLKALREYKNEQMDKKLAELRLKQRDSQTKRIQSRQITQAKAKIRKNIEKLNSMLAHGTEKRHVPINMVRATIEMLEAIDINTGNSKSLAKYLEKMDNIYKGLKGAEAYAFDYDERTQQTLDTLKKMFEGRNYTMLTLDELNQVVDITKQLVTQIENANKIMLDKKKLDAIEFSKQAIKEVREAKGKDNKFMTALDKYLTPHLNAYREFRKISGYTDGAIMELYKDLDKGQLKQLQVMKDINALFDDVLKNTKKVKAFTSTDEKDLVDSGLRDEKGNPVMITKAQRMALIMSSYNERNMEHITFGGVKVPDVKQKKREDALSKGKTYWYESPVEIRDAIYSEDADKLRLITDRASMKVKELEKGLSPWEKEFLDKVKEMFWHKTGSWINKTSLELKGYALARVNNYFPIVSDKNFVNQDVGGLVQDGTLEGWGNLKERKFGRNAIVLEDITDTILRQTNDVAKYVGLVVPIRNLNVAWNTNVYDVTTATRHTLKEAMDVWGANNKKYIENLIKDMTSRRDGGDPTFLDALRGRFAGAVLTLNPSVAIKQTASYFTAGAIVGNKTLAKTVKDIGKGFITKKGIPELEAINPLLWYRNQGNATQELADMKKTGLGKNLPTWMQKALNWVEFMDTGTVRTLEYAAKNYVDDHYIGANKLEGEEYWQKVSEVFTKIVEETQPNYTPLQQADIIRNPNKAMKMLVMFKTQPLQNFGVLYDSIGELKAKVVAKDQEGIKSAKKKVARAVVSQIQSAMTFSMMTILADLLLHKYYKYKDDDDKFSWDEVLAKFGAGITDSFWGMLLFGQDLYKAVDSFINGEKVNGLNVSYLENIANFANAIQKLYQESQKRLEAITEEDKQKYDNGIIIDTGNVINYFGQIVGLPTGNIKNMAESLILYSMDVRDGKIGESEFSRDVDTQNQRMYDALVANDSERYHKLFDEAVLKKTENGTDQDKAEESVESGIKKLIQKGYDSGELTFDEAYTILTKEMGMDETDAYFKLDEWLYKSEGNDSYSRYSRMFDAINKAIETDDRKGILEEIQKLKDNKVDVKNIQSMITKEYKAKYLELKAQKKSATLKSVLISAYMATGLSQDDAKKRIDNWK